MVDWKKIKTEYITTNTSYRKLAEKYGVHYKVISERGKAEKWVELRSQHRDKTFTKAMEQISDRQADQMARIHASGTAPSTMRTYSPRGSVWEW